MITGAASVRAAAADLLAQQQHLRLAAAEAVEAILDDLLVRLPPATPVRSGRMQAGYSKTAAGLSGQIEDTQFYAGWVARTGTRRMRPNPNLLRILEEADAESDTLIEALISARMGRP